MLDRYPECKSPICFHRLHPEAESIAVCGVCGYMLSIEEASVRNELACWLQDFLSKCLTHGNVELLGTGNIRSVDFFPVVRQLLTLLATRGERKKLGLSVIKESGLFDPASGKTRRKQFIEFYNIDERLLLMELGGWLFQDWPDRFLGVCQKHNIYPSELLQYHKNNPLAH